MVSGSLADQGKSSLTWTVTDLDWSYRVYCQDCRTVARRPKRVPRGIRKEL